MFTGGISAEAMTCIGHDSSVHFDESGNLKVNGDDGYWGSTQPRFYYYAITLKSDDVTFTGQELFDLLDYDSLPHMDDYDKTKAIESLQIYKLDKSDFTELSNMYSISLPYITPQNINNLQNIIKSRLMKSDKIENVQAGYLKENDFWIASGDEIIISCKDGYVPVKDDYPNLKMTTEIKQTSMGPNIEGCTDYYVTLDTANLQAVYDACEEFLQNDNVVYAHYLPIVDPYTKPTYEVILKDIADKTGDINNNGEIDITDLVLLAKYICNKSTDITNADLNNDGKINIIDLITMSKQLLQ